MSWDNNNAVGSTLGPRTVSYQLATQMYEYLMRAFDLGAFEGPIGDQKMNPALAPIMEALHHVLAGGAVKLEVLQRGNPDIVNELNRRIVAAGNEANDINKKAGYYVTMFS